MNFKHVNLKFNRLMSNSNFTKKLEHILKEYRTAIIDEICKDF